MKCIKCSREIPDGELFCAICSKIPPQPKSAPLPQAKPAKKVPGTEKPAVRQPSGHAKPTLATRSVTQKNMQSAQTAHPRRPVKLIISLILACLAVAGLLVFIFASWGKLALQRTSLRVREADLALREAAVDELETTLTGVHAELETANKTIDELELENKDLRSQLSGTQSTMSQTQFDMTTQQQALEQLLTENETFSTQVDALETKTGDLQSKLSGLTASNAIYSTKADFMDSYVVFVNNDGSKYYHKYDCKDFKRQSFWAYSRKLAESSGFTVCPNCGA